MQDSVLIFVVIALVVALIAALSARTSANVEGFAVCRQSEFDIEGGKDAKTLGRRQYEFKNRRNLAPPHFVDVCRNMCISKPNCDGFVLDRQLGNGTYKSCWVKKMKKRRGKILFDKDPKRETYIKNRIGNYNC